MNALSIAFNTASSISTKSTILNFVFAKKMKERVSPNGIVYTVLDYAIAPEVLRLVARQQVDLISDFPPNVYSKTEDGAYKPIPTVDELYATRDATVLLR